MTQPYREAPRTVTARTTRGVAVIALAKAYFLVTGFAQPIVLLRLLGLEQYGVYGAVLNAVSILNNVVVAGSIQAMSRSVTTHGTRAIRYGLWLHAAFGLVAAGTLALGADVLGTSVLHDPALAPLLRIAAVIVGDYALYAALVGVLNGEQRFRAQAMLDMTFATLRTGLVLGLAATHFKVAGAIAGFAIASALITACALVAVFRGRRAVASDGVTFASFSREYSRFLAPTLLYQLALNLVLQADLLVMKRLLADRFETRAVDATVGIYKSVQNFAFLPYQLLLAVTFVAFPVVSQSTLAGDREATQRFVAGALRFSTLALGAMLSVLAGLPAPVLRLAYPAVVAQGAGALQTLALGQGALALTCITTTILLAAGRTLLTTVLMLGTLVAVLAGDVAGVLTASDPRGVLDGVALGTTAGCALGLIAVAIAARRSLGAFVPVGTLVRTALAGVVAAGAVALGAHAMGLADRARFSMVDRGVTVVLAGVAVVLYVVALVASGEITASERRAVAGRMGMRAG